MSMKTHPQCGSEKEQGLFGCILSCVFQCRSYFVRACEAHSDVGSLV
jgi:hypothetical protein